MSVLYIFINNFSNLNAVDLFLWIVIATMQCT